jgi:hypothetical protein
MKTCARCRPDGTCPELERNNPASKIMGSECMFCINDMAEICDKYREPKYATRTN